jgi:two-component system, chemotaxis family, protein-glutamate methylesterase/glutaminase
MEKKFLLPGEYHITKRPMNLVTVLGSCVSICLYNKKYGLAAMNHYVFPEGENIDKSSRGRYGNLANRLITESLLAVDGERGHYTAKVFGGANPLNSDIGSDTQIGNRNVAAAEAFLLEARIPIVEKVTGSQKGYRIYFNTETGDVKAEEIKTVSNREKQLEKEGKLGIKKKRVLVVDDSALVRKVLTNAINSIPEYEVCGQAADAFEARDMLVNLTPDIMTLDIIMPKLDGISFLQKVTKHFPLPVIICSTIAKEGTKIQKDAYAAGAIEVIDKDTLELYKGEGNVQKVIKQKLDLALAKYKKKLSW